MAEVDDAGDSTSESGTAPKYEASAEVVDRNISIEYEGLTIASSDKAVLYRESRLPPVYYFPRSDVRMDLLRRTRYRTHCPFKGNASYWSLIIGDREVKDVVWSYENPLEDLSEIKGYLAFWLSKLGVSYTEDGEYAGHHTRMDTHGSAFVDWLLREGWDSQSPSDLTEKLAILLRNSGVPLARLSVFIRTLHPLLIGSAYVWRQDRDKISSFVLTHDTLGSPLFLDSPLVPIFSGAGGIRRRLEGDNPIMDFGILKQLHEEGITDYAAMPMIFSDGQINVLTLATDRPGGFSTSDLGQLHEILPLLSRLFEVHAARAMAGTLLQTYLGRTTGEKVLNGQIKRGDSEELHAVIWFCDLRESTVLADTMPPDAYLAMLNRFLESMVKPVVEYGGEILNFIGDAVLVVFPLDDDGMHHQSACDDALAAAADAEERMKLFNEERVADGLKPLGYGIGLHLGRLSYGNIGIDERLQFTVIGAAANEASRIEGLTKDLEYTVLASAEFADRCSIPMKPVGEFELRGVAQKEKIFTPQSELGF